jgi:hypothetical protein
MRKQILTLAIAMALLSLLTTRASADCLSGTIIISPNGNLLPMMLTTRQTFTIESGNTSTGLFPYIVLVMTKASYDGLTGPVTVNWTGASGQYNESTFPKLTFTTATTGYIPDPTLTPYDSGRYEVQSLKTQLGVNGTKDDFVYYNLGPFLGGSAIGRLPKEFTVNLPATNPKMLVLAVARSGVCTPFFNMRVQPCTPGFIIPEVPPMLIVMVSFAAVGLYAVKRKKH